MKPRIQVFPKPIPWNGPREEAYSICVGEKEAAVLYFSPLTPKRGTLTVFKNNVSGYYDFELHQAGLDYRPQHLALIKSPYANTT